MLSPEVAEINIINIFLIFSAFKSILSIMNLLFYYFKTLSLLLLVASCNPLGTENFIGNNFRPGFISQGVSLKAIPALLRGNQSVSIQFTIDSEVKDPRLLISYDGGASFTELSPLTPSSTSHTWMTPSDRDGDEIVFKLEGINSKEEKVESVSRIIKIDSVAPAAPVLSLVGPTLTNSLSVNFNLASCDDLDQIFISEVSSVPSHSASGWRSCSVAVNYSLSSGDGAKSIFVFAKDLAGNISSSGQVSLTLDRTPPSPLSVGLASPVMSNSLTSAFTLSSCTDYHSVLVTETNVKPNGSSLGWISCSTGAGAISHDFVSLTEGNRSLYVWGRDAAGNISESTRVDRVYDKTPPLVQEVVLNPSGPLDLVGDIYSGTANLTVRLKVTESISSIVLRVLEVSSATGCEEQFTDGNWISYTEQVYLTVAPLDGTKKVCVWAKDEADNRSVISGSTPELANVNMDTIIYEVGNIPQITQLEAKNKANGGADFLKDELVEINYTVTDAEGLDLNPVSISYTVNNTTWIDVISGLDSSIPTNVRWIGSLSSVVKTHSGSLDVPAPSSGYFKYKIVAKDRAGNMSVAIYSAIMNGSPWSIYAGSTDAGNNGTALAARIRSANGNNGHFSISPKTNDVYMVDWVNNVPNVRKLDSRTGLVTSFITHGVTNLTHNGNLPPAINISTPSTIRFDNAGALYVSSLNALWKIDLENKKSYVMVDELWPGQSAFTFDESDNLYYFELCPSESLSWRMMKLSQENNLPKDKTHIAGNCELGTPIGTGPLDPKEVPLGVGNGTVSFPKALSSVTAWENGKYIYFTYYSSGGAYKIIDGQLFRSNIPIGFMTSFHFSKYEQKLYVVNSNVSIYTPNLAGANGDTVGSAVLVPDNNSGSCVSDDILHSSACVKSGLGGDFSSSGIFFFTDGSVQNAPGTYRIRYVDPSTKNIKTLVGSLPFYGDGMKKELIRGDIGGIHYKVTSSPGFPAGLYFTDYSAMIIGRIDPIDHNVTVMFGDQSSRAIAIPDKGIVDKSTSLGPVYVGGNGKSLMFDEFGVPWFRASDRLYSINYDEAVKKYKLIHKMTGNINWGDASDNDAPINHRIYVFGGQANLTGSSKGSFFIGVSLVPGTGNKKPSIRYFDFEHNNSRKILGSLTSEDAVSSADSVLADEIIKDKPLACLYQDVCFMYYDSSSDTLYFRERFGDKLRYITNVLSTNPSVPKLRSIILKRNPGNFSFRPGHPNELYYIAGGKLYCKNITGVGCDDTTDLGPNSLIGTIGSSGNQFTWVDSNTLLISSYNGVIFKYQIP
jgi:hypothetical protein